METLVPLVVGFVLTTVLGGLLGTYLQWRTWDHQNETPRGGVAPRRRRLPVREWTTGRLDGLDRRLGELDDTAYQLNVFMMTQLREGAVGRRAPRPLDPPRLERHG